MPTADIDGHQVFGQLASILTAIQEQKCVGVSMSLQNILRARTLVALSIMPLLVQTTIGNSRFAYADETKQKSTDSIDEIVFGAVEQESSETIYEITVYGNKSLSALRRDVYMAEENFFDVFNSLNQDDEYDVRCYYEVPSFTHIRHHVCRANFVVDATSAEAEMWRTEKRERPIAPAAWKIQSKKKRLRELMEALVDERPELNLALNKYTEAKEVLESERKRR